MPEKNASKIWEWKNTAHITKMSIEGVAAVASLAAAVTALLAVTNVIAAPACLALVTGPAGIVALFVAAAYFTALAYSSYQQMNKNEEIDGVATKAEEAKKAAETAIGQAKGAATEATEAAEKANKAKDAAAKSAGDVENLKGNFATKDDLKANKAEVDTELGKKLDSGDLQGKIEQMLPGLLQGPEAMKIFEDKFQAKQA
ncbi:hypothetical protein [Candidatus Wolbachia massiliensis]|uniref:Uncharacterized protein n=1 Tax=Candidatus Wolbachia massiliensis TaxID=1845000 RepID=A0A7L7YRE3_9RICK|nr:hypothetical protein [Candidatus Wolbachia massiliensis]QOD38237.1 hypothetical protein ID128_05655 [Candidatus Wolbachia massiliensis]